MTVLDRPFIKYQRFQLTFKCHSYQSRNLTRTIFLGMLLCLLVNKLDAMALSTV